MKYNFGNRLQQLLNENNLSQRQLAKKVNITEAAVSRYINNLQKPRSDILTDIAITLNTTTDFLLGREKSLLSNHSYSDLISLIRKKQGDKTLNQFASICKINAGHLSRILNGNFKNPPSPETLKKISNNDDILYEELLIAAGYIDINIKNSKIKILVDKINKLNDDELTQLIDIISKLENERHNN